MWKQHQNRAAFNPFLSGWKRVVLSLRMKKTLRLLVILALLDFFSGTQTHANTQTTFIQSQNSLISRQFEMADNRT